MSRCGTGLLLLLRCSHPKPLTAAWSSAASFSSRRGARAVPQPPHPAEGRAAGEGCSSSIFLLLLFLWLASGAPEAAAAVGTASPCPHLASGRPWPGPPARGAASPWRRCHSRAGRGPGRGDGFTQAEVVCYRAWLSFLTGKGQCVTKSSWLKLSPANKNSFGVCVCISPLSLFADRLWIPSGNDPEYLVFSTRESSTRNTL